MGKKLNSALVLAGGMGTRLREITKDLVPKPMAVIAGKPILEHTINKLKQNGITEIVISVGYLHEVIEDYFKDGKSFGVDISYIVETEPLGSGGALYYLKDKFDSDFLVCPGDAIFDIDIDRMYQYHKAHDALITLFSHPNIHPYDSDLIITDGNGKVLGFDKKTNTRDYFYSNSVNAGIFVINSSALDYFDIIKKVNMEHDFVAAKLCTGRVYAYESSEYVKDVGTPDRFYATEKDIESGVVAARNLRNKQKAIFLDRDGTINIYRGFIRRVDDIDLIDGVVEAIQKINASEYLAIVVSNQPVIARGEASFDEVDNMFRKIETILGKSGAYLDDIYYCPHHPHKGYEGEIVNLKIKCNCRKPNIGMLLQAKEKYNLDLSKCYIIGDSHVDVQTGINAGIKSIKIDSDLKEEEEIVADCYANNLLDAVNLILQEK